MPSSRPRPSVGESLALLRTSHREVLDDVANGERVFWIGSGISRDQVPPLEELIGRVIAYLQAKADCYDVSDPHFVALQSIAHQFFSDESTVFDADPAGWVPSVNGLLSAVDEYSEILATEVEGEEDDYLLWDGIDVRETYGSPTIQPGPEHHLIAAMVCERLVEAMVTTNWDGLLELAGKRAGATEARAVVAVHMTNSSFQTERGIAELNKIHGCAVLARNDPDTYRKYLVARITDLVTWTSQEIFDLVIAKIEALFQHRRSVFLGLSVQDYNLLTMMARAAKAQSWAWNATNPAYVFAVEELGQRQRQLLNIVYEREDRGLRPEIRTGSSLGMYSGPVLACLVIHALRRKLEVGLERASDYNAGTEVLDTLSAGLESLEAGLLRSVGSKLDVLVRVLQQGMTRLLGRYFDPSDEPLDGSYRPLFAGTVHDCAISPEFKHLSLPELAVALGLVGVGRAKDLWEPILGASGELTDGTLILRSKLSHRRVMLVLTRNESATSDFKASDLWQHGRETIVLLQTTGRRPTSAVRGLGAGIGAGRRVGTRRRQSWLADLQPALGAPSDLLSAFRAEVAL